MPGVENEWIRFPGLGMPGPSYLIGAMPKTRAAQFPQPATFELRNEIPRPTAEWSAIYASYERVYQGLGPAPASGYGGCLLAALGCWPWATFEGDPPEDWRAQPLCAEHLRRWLANALARVRHTGTDHLIDDHPAISALLP